MKRYLSLIEVVFFIFLCGCGPRLYKDSDLLMGTLVEVVSSDPRAKDIVFDEFRRLEKIFNLFDDTSELSLLNSTGEMSVSEDMFGILKKAQGFFNSTQGAFDVTVAPLSLLWKKSIKKSRFPSSEEIEASLANVGFDFVYLEEGTRRVKLLKEGMRLDFGALAKGYALDLAVRRLKGAGINDALINAGGDLYCLGDNRRRMWRVGIQHPRRAGRVIKTLNLADRACATSGDYEQFFVFKDTRYSHIINPKTGYPAQSGVISATVLAPEAATADALATACVVLGEEKSRILLKNYRDVHAVLVSVHGDVAEI